MIANQLINISHTDYILDDSDALFQAATLILAVLGLLGNLLVVLVILSRRRWRFANSMFILNIAIANLFICTLTLPLLTRALFDLR